jgi:hypothetical protein
MGDLYKDLSVTGSVIAANGWEANNVSLTKYQGHERGLPFCPVYVLLMGDLYKDLSVTGSVIAANSRLFRL